MSLLPIDYDIVKFNHNDLDRKVKQYTKDKKDLWKEFREAKLRIKELELEKKGMEEEPQKITSIAILGL